MASTLSHSPLTWFERVNDVARISLDDLARVDRPLDPGVAGPTPLAVGEWIIQLTDDAVDDVSRITDVTSHLQASTSDVSFRLIEGLGSKGLVLMEVTGASRADIETSLGSIDAIEHFGLNQLIRGQEVRASDTDFARGAMPSLDLIGMPAAWKHSIGSLSTVVGVLDTGIDLAHRDLYLNIWLNQGEIPRRFFAEDGTLLLQDIDEDRLITFYDLNHATRSSAAPFELTVAGFQNGPNKEFVSDINSNGYIDALDILADPLWADGRDSDGNGEVDDFVGLNLRGEGLPPNNPMDTQGHGTHVAGTIGAVGGNSSGVTGINWQVSLMPLRILDSSNQGDTGAALRALNYAKNMRERYRVEDDGRVVEGANVRVLNNSWGRSGLPETALETAITESGEAGILFVAASGNGNFLGQGVDNDRTPFFPSSYNSPNIIAVAASTLDDRLASFSNFGDQSVDIAAPGVGIRSTELGGGYGTRNGTSMATPHVAGTAALIWSALPGATVSEVTAAVTTTGIKSAPFSDVVKEGGRSHAAAAILADVFAPSARLFTAQNITTVGGTTAEFTVEYFHRSGFDRLSIEQAKLLITRQWGYGDQLTPRLKPGSVSISGSTARATYLVDAPGGTWDKLDFGDYRIETIAESVSAQDGTKINQQAIGAFNVTISPQSDPSVIYVSTFNDRIDEGSLRDAILTANRRNGESTIILNAGTYLLEIPPVIDPEDTFPPIIDTGEFVPTETSGSSAATGDLVIKSNITIVGSRNLDTIIDAQELDRVFRVSPETKLTLRNLTLQNGVGAGIGGSILALGDVDMDLVIVRDSRAVLGSGIASLGGHTQITGARFTNNTSQFASIYIAGNASAEVVSSTIDNNGGGGLRSFSTGDVTINTSTFSGNRGGLGAVANGFGGAEGSSSEPSLSADGRFVAFVSNASNLVPGDNNGVPDIFVYDRQERRFERVSVNDAGEGGNDFSESPSMSVDGRFVTFQSFASNLVPGDNNDFDDIFVYDRQERRIERVSVNDAGEEGDGSSFSPSLSADGRFVTFQSFASNLDPGDSNGSTVASFVYDRLERRIERVSVNEVGEDGNGFSFSPSLSADGRFVTFSSSASNLVPGDNNDFDDIFVYDRQGRRIERVSVNDAGEEGNNFSGSPSLSADGRFVTFESFASNLVPGDNNDLRDIFVYDRQERRIERVNINNAGEEGNRDSGAGFLGESPSLSADGRFVTFSSSASNLVPGDNNNESDTFLYDRQERRIERVSVNNAGEEGNDFSGSPSLSAEGRFVTFSSSASNLVPGDNNNFDDIFVYDRQERRIERVVMDFGSLTIVGSSFVDNEATRTLAGIVDVSSSLFAGNVVNREADSNALGQFFNLRLNDVQRLLVGPLGSDSHLPPTHRLLLGNPAINQGDPTLAGTQDQNNALRGDLPEVGAIDALNGSVGGVTFADLNGNAKRDNDEPLVTVADLEISRESGADKQLLSVNGSGEFRVQQLEPGYYQLVTQPSASWTQTPLPIELIRGETAANDGTSGSPSLSADGRFVAFESFARNLVPGDNNFTSDIFVYDRQERRIERVSINDAREAGNRSSFSPSISADGRFVTFESDASNLVPGDNNATLDNFFRGSDIFVYDRQEQRIERVSVNNAGEEGNGDSSSPSLSADGRFVTFVSVANNLVPGDNNAALDDTISGSDIFVYDRQEQRIERVSVNNAGEQGNGDSSSPSLSADGRFVTFGSFASNLVPDDNNATPGDPFSGSDTFVYDRQERRIERVSVNEAGEEGNGDSFSPLLSADGRFVSFVSNASNLVPEDNNNTNDIFVYDRQERRIERVSVNDAGEEGNSFSSSPLLSADGRFVTFESSASNLVLGDNNATPGDPFSGSDIFVYDRENRRIERVSGNEAGEEGNSDSSSPMLSADGRLVTFASFASNLVPGDNNGFRDVFIVPNPFLPPSVAGTLRAGETVNVEIPFKPNPGTISGQLFLDSAVLNGVFDLGEEVLASHRVFLDTNRNGLFDRGEPLTLTDAAGRYRFDDVPAFRNQTIVVAAPTGFEQIVPERQNQPGFTVFLLAGGDLNGVDFGFRPITTTGQSSDSTIRGRVMIDSRLNGIIDEEDTPAANRVVYMDAGTLGVRDFNDPQAVTDAEGHYVFTGLPATITPLRVILDETVEQVSPVGSLFDLQRFPLQDREKREGNPQAVLTADFSGDGFLDAAVVLAETNTLSIRLNDGSGGFTSRKIDLNLSELAGTGNKFLQPTSIVAGAFDADPRIDVALTGNFSSSVLILRNFDVASGTFANVQLVGVGTEPIDLVTGQFGGNSAIDLVVLNKGDGQVQILTNDGAGTFSAGIPISTGGFFPTSIVAADFSGDGELDVAVVHAAISATNVTAGRVTLLTGNGTGGLTLSPTAYTVQASPTDAAVGDFNDDGRPDIAVVNNSSNSISILLSQADGTLRVQSATLGTVQGAVDIAVADIDNDGDDDVLATKLQRREVAIFRNIGTDSVTGDVRFEPQENIGLGEFSFAERAPFAVANLDNNTSGPGGSGTIDIIAVPQNTDTLYVLKNTLVQGARRAAVSGARSDVASGVDFLIRPAILPPFFAPIIDPAPIVEDSLETTMTIGGIRKGRDSGPTPRFFVTSDNASLIPSLGQIDYAGGDSVEFTYMPLPDVNGRAVLTIRAVDAGANESFGDADDGVFERSVTVTVNAVNDPPVFTINTEISATQKGSSQSISEFATGLAAGGGPDEATQMLSSFTITTDNSFFTVPPAIDTSGSLAFTPNPNQSGAVPVVVSLTDNGGRANGGSDSTSKTFVINLLAVNDPPSITIGDGQEVQVGSGLRTVDNFASNFSPGGGADEASQTISGFVVTVDLPGLFSVLPDIDNAGRLTFAPASDRTGTATVNVRVRDTGGRANGGDDLSPEATFTILVAAAPGPRVLRPTQDGEPVDLSLLPNDEISGVETIDLSGFGSNRLVLSAPRIKAAFANSSATVIAEPSDTIVFDGQWTFDGVEVVDGTVFRQFSQDGASLMLNGPQTFSNPMNRFDVDGNGSIASLDALRIINALSRKVVVDSAGILVPLTPANTNRFQFFDVTRDNRLTPLDALLVINALSRISRGGIPEGEAAPTDASNISTRSEIRADEEIAVEISMPANRTKAAAAFDVEMKNLAVAAVDQLMSGYGTEDEAPISKDAGQLRLFHSTAILR